MNERQKGLRDIYQCFQESKKSIFMLFLILNSRYFFIDFPNFFISIF